jgi:Copper amine oxidase N-terminal domain
MKLPISPVLSAITAVVFITGSVTVPALAQSVNVTLNGAPVALNPAPQTRAGRVFVPLRGIFENLGATVVYSNGVINAQGNGRAISLHIGSTQATVDGQPQTLDVAPFIIGASTYVPLRFVSQALGASVNYDGGNHIVAISNGGAAPSQVIRPNVNNNNNGSALRLANVTPARGSSVASRRPTIEAQFTGGRADPNSLRISVDGTDVTDQTSRSPVGFVFAPQSPLQSMEHAVRVRGTDTNGNAIDQAWRFSSGTSAVETGLEVLTPQNGATVGNQFTVRGRTTPGARVVVQAGSSGGNNANSVLGAILGIGGGANVRNEVVANGDGTFSTVVSLNAQPGSNVRLVVTSTDPRTQTASPPVGRNLIIQ